MKNDIKLNASDEKRKQNQRKEQQQHKNWKRRTICDFYNS